MILYFAGQGRQAEKLESFRTCGTSYGVLFTFFAREQRRLDYVREKREVKERSKRERKR